MSRQSSKPGTAATLEKGLRRRAARRDSTAPCAAAGVGAAGPVGREEDQRPPTSLDDPSSNLHPARIWPD